jgi:hypothetical protein
LWLTPQCWQAGNPTGEHQLREFNACCTLAFIWVWLHAAYGPLLGSHCLCGSCDGLYGPGSIYLSRPREYHGGFLGKS